MRARTAIILFCLSSAPALAAAQSPLANLSDPEKTYYEQVFSYTMDTVSEGGHYDWKSYGANGTIVAQKPYLSKSNSTCRNFSETFAVGTQTGNDRGVACKRTGKDGWCRLKPDNALTCALEEPDMFRVELPGFSTGSIPGINIGSGDSGSGNANVDTNVNANIDTTRHPSGGGDAKSTGMGIANTVTGAAGAAAGGAANAVKGFLSDSK